MKKILILIGVVIFLTACTQHVRDEDNRVVRVEETGQNLTANILCRPESEEMLKLYEEHSENLPNQIEDLPSCKEFRINSSGYSGLWETIFVRPLAWLILTIGQLVRNYGLSVMIVGLLIRLAMLPLSLKTARQSEVMKKVQPEMAKIEKKYKDKKDSASMMAKSQETMMIYKKYKVSPLSGCLMAFVQLPIFFAFLEAINRVPAIFEDNFLTLNLGTTPWIGIGNGQYLYIVLIALIIGKTYFAFKNTMSSEAAGTGKTGAQMQFMGKFMIIFISIISLSLPTAIALYWTVTNGFAVVQNLIVKRGMEK